MRRVGPLDAIRAIADKCRELSDKGGTTLDEAVSRDELRLEVEELRASRARVMAAADDERRRIERGLHDGVQQHLVALAVNLQLARELAVSDPPAAKTLLEEVGQDVRDALESVRELAYSIYPPLLLDRGVAEALRGAAAGAAIATRIDAETTDRYPPEIEAAVYFCCLEALEGAAEHAGPEARAAVRVWPEHKSLLFEIVIDSSVAGDGDLVSGAALTSMNDRVGAAGGRLSVSAEPGHTRVLGTIPLAR
jgi:signal transduction histidine kinase